VPLLATETFGIGMAATATSFLVSFGATKALANLFAGTLSERHGRRRILILGWLVGVPVPLLIIAAPDWGWVVLANAFLGINQGLTWSMTVNMKVDLAGPRRRGLALGLNESAGYLAVGAAAFAAGVVAERYGLRPEPFYLGIAFVAAGLALSVLFVRDTGGHVALERATEAPDTRAHRSLRSAFSDGTLHRPDLQALSQAGLVNNANDALVWALLPIILLGRGMHPGAIAAVAASYPITWGLCQIPAGWLSDRIGRWTPIVAGMLLQGIAVAGFMVDAGLEGALAAAIALGVGTALVYPALLAAVSDRVPAVDRATSVGVYRFWRDIGTMAGALAVGVLADSVGREPAIGAVALATLASGLVVAARLPRDIRLGREAAR
jgi:MFS family permease